VFSSNAFAILGLRALYFLLADLRDRFDYLQQGLAVILAFVGLKMILAEWWHINTFLSLGFIAVVLTVAIALSWFKDRNGNGTSGDDGDHAVEPAGSASALSEH
jgi:tellurite resistance protein TerC